MAAPLGQRAPSLWGLRGSPSMLTIFPSTVCTSVAHPTEQYGQTLGVALACLIRSSCARASVGARLTPSPAMPPSAVPVKAPADRLKKSRRDRSMSPPGQGEHPHIRVDSPLGGNREAIGAEARGRDGAFSKNTQGGPGKPRAGPHALEGGRAQLPRASPTVSLERTFPQESERWRLLIADESVQSA